ncbi:MAG: isopentenyl phosphate kinase family protein [Thermoplasmata archaeon]|nr:isopentenyl phosphate kinase family protein [Thermoplasmata archaeon]
MIVIKLGGSVITDKAGERALRKDRLASLAGAIAGMDEEVVVVHGAGSFGHPLAKRSGVGSGPHEERRSLDASRIGRDVRELDLAVVDALIAAGRPTVSVPPSAIVVTRARAVETFFRDALVGWMERGFTPVTFGDIVFDRALGVAIVSGDALMYELARSLGARMAVFVSDVDGVFDRDPREEGATLLDVVSPSDDVGFGEVARDVTGALHGKLGWMFRTAEAGVETWMVNGKHPERLAALQRGEGVRGTRVVSGGATPD